MAAIRPLDALLFEHPRSVGESYPEHLGTAWAFGARMFVGAVAAFVHGLLPCAFQTSASDVVRRLHAQLERRGSQPHQ